MSDSLLKALLIFIAAATVVSGLAQMMASGTIFGIIAAAPTPAGAHLFATIGMFMVITGAMFLQVLLTRSAERAVPLWIGVQKALAAILVPMAVVKGYFLWPSLGVAAFDAASAVLVLMFWWRSKP